MVFKESLCQMTGWGVALKEFPYGISDLHHNVFVFVVSGFDP
jgi:hypothetical protein